jgi:hypothetical protein
LDIIVLVIVGEQCREVKKMHLNIRVGGKLGLFLSGDEDGGRLLT